MRRRRSRRSHSRVAGWNDLLGRVLQVRLLSRGRHYDGFVVALRIFVFRERRVEGANFSRSFTFAWLINHLLQCRGNLRRYSVRPASKTVSTTIVPESAARQLTSRMWSPRLRGRNMREAAEEPLKLTLRPSRYAWRISGDSKHRTAIDGSPGSVSPSSRTVRICADPGRC